VSDYDGWLTAGEAAAAIGVTRQTIRRWALDGRVEHRRWRGMYVVPAAFPERMRAAGYEGAMGLPGSYWWERFSAGGAS
jgi:excisionase family DNA binding protein